MKQLRTFGALVLGVAIMISMPAYAGTQQDFEKALAYLKKARATGAVLVKNENLKKARELIVLSKYNTGNHGSAVITLINQAIKNINDFKLDKANIMIDGAIDRVRKAIQAIKQEAAARAKSKTEVKTKAATGK
jgi:hypothetical protein